MKKKVQVYIYFKKVVIIMDFLNRVKDMVLVLFMIRIYLLYIMVFGKMIIKKVVVQKYIKMGVNMMVILLMIKEKVLVVWNIQLRCYIQENGKKV